MPTNSHYFCAKNGFRLDFVLAYVSVATGSQSLRSRALVFCKDLTSTLCEAVVEGSRSISLKRVVDNKFIEIYFSDFFAIFFKSWQITKFLDYHQNLMCRYLFFLSFPLHADMYFSLSVVQSFFLEISVI